jgi:hypothetical protein
LLHPLSQNTDLGEAGRTQGLRSRCGELADHHKGLRLTEPLMPFLRLRGTLGAELTRYEWESAHYALRALFKVIAPDTSLEAKSPTLPKPKGLDAFLDK